MKNPLKKILCALVTVCAYLCSSSGAKAAEPVAFSDKAIIEPQIIDFGDLPGDSTYTFFLNGVKGGGSTAIAGNDAFALKLDQWNNTGNIGFTEFGVVDYVFEPWGQGSPETVFEENIHLTFVNNKTVGEVLIYVDGELAGYVDANFDLSGESGIMAARMSLETDIMGEGSVIYSWASYDQVLDEDTIRELADAAVPTELPEIEVDPEEVIASSFYAHLNPKLVDFGELSESATYVFSFKAAKGGASTAIAGNDSVALKLDQWNEQGIFGLTVFGVADHVFEPVGEGSTSSVFDENVHVAYVNDLVLGETRLYVNGTLAGKLAANFELTGEAGVMAARLSLNTDPMANGSIMYNWATYNSALSDEAIAALASEAVYYDPTGPHTSPIVVDFGPLSVEGLPEPYTFEFFFNAQKAGVSTAIAGDDSWALKLDQWNEQGIFGITEFGVMDYVFEVDGQASVESVFGEDVHVVMVNDVDLGECRLYIDGEYAGYIEANFNLSGPTAVMAARLNLGTDPMGEGSVFYYWDTHAGVLSQEQIKSLYANAETRDPVDPVDPTGPEVPDGALDEPTLVDLGDASLDSSLEFSFNAIKAGASTAIAGNDSWALKLDQWNEQGVFGMTEFGVMDYVFEPEGPGDTSSIFEEDVHVVFVNDVSNGETRLYVNGLYAGYIEANFMLSGETALMAARLNLGTDPMAPGSLMYSWKLHPSVLSESEIAALASPKTTTTMSLFKLDFGANQNDTDGVELTDWDVIGNWTFDDFDDGNAVWALSDFGAGTDTDVTLTIVDNDDLNAETGASPAAGMIGNNPTQENIDVIYDGIEIPYVVKDDYLYRNPDTAGTELLFQVANLDPGTYNVTLFEGRTTDQSQVARMWVGDASGSNEPSQPNTGSFSGVGPDGPDPEGFPQTLVLDIGAGDYLWYAHMEDNSGGISGMIIRAMSPSDAESGNISSVALTDGNVVIEYTGTLKSSVSVTGPFDDVPAATSPFTVPTTKAAEFFIAD
ncbi:MAG TPA: hypothetical protein DHV39_04685 [Verrucomicrobiales bacterium]|nr:hypothetical protein [Verrucomicrobiales bacterium]